MKLVEIDAPQYQEMVNILVKNPTEFLLSPHCRQFLAMSNFHKRGGKVSVHTASGGDVMPGTVEHNRIQIDEGTYSSYLRTARLIGPICALDHIFHAPERFKVLSIGPRTEMELYHLVGCGFLPQNISAIDLISPSPWIDVGDMHAMPYADQSFDICISSWVLAYSRAPQKAVDEMMRVTKSGGIVAIGCTYEPNWRSVEYKSDDRKIVGSMFRHVSEIAALIGPRLEAIHFQTEPPTDEKGSVMLIARIRH